MLIETRAIFRSTLNLPTKVEFECSCNVKGAWIFASGATIFEAQSEITRKLQAYTEKKEKDSRLLS